MSYRTVFRNDLFAGRTALVTGGGSGIGRCIAHEMAALGAEVTVAGRTRAKLEAVVDEIASDGGQAHAAEVDIRDQASVEALFVGVMERHERLDLLVNNGGGQFAAPAVAISERGWRAVIETNLSGTFAMCKEAFTSSMAEHGGAIVNIVADMFRGMPMMAHSGAARAGVVNLTQTLALEWAQTGTRINAVAPGVIASSGLSNYPDGVREAIKELPKQLPAGRLGTESEVAAAAVFLLSPAARYVNGVTLRVDGASSLYRHSFDLAPDRMTPAYDGFHRKPSLPSDLEGLTGSDPDESGLDRESGD
ncbi:MAG: SDR family oxidoreductase [Myxococcota bacterium]